MLVVAIRLDHGPAGDMLRTVPKVEERIKVPQEKHEMFIFGNELGTSTSILRLSISVRTAAQVSGDTQRQ